MTEDKVPELIPEYVEQLLSLIPALEDPDEKHSELWTKEGCFPTIVNSRQLGQLVELAHDSNLVYPFNWQAWPEEAARYCNDPTLLSSADLSTIRKLLTVHVRKDRFCGGHLAAMVEEGHLIAILYRLRELMRFPYLPPDRIILYVEGSNRYMQMARKVADELSLDTEHPTGAVVVKDKRVLGRGANGSEYHQIHGCARKGQGSVTGEEYDLCEGCNPRHHAEPSAIREALANAENPHGADLFLWGHWWCCKPCWECMIKHGIRKVYLVEGAEKKFKRSG